MLVLRWLYSFCDGVRHRRRTKASDPDHALGRRGEDVAHRFLQRKGYYIIARNHRTKTGSAEVDLIAMDGDIVVFVEVKTRTSAEHGAPERAIDEAKRRKIVSGADHYLRHSNDLKNPPVRFDVVTVVLTPELLVEHIEDAFRPAMKAPVG
jgi:putative endonuclease